MEGLGTAGGFKIVIEDRGDNGLPALQATTDRCGGNSDEQSRAPGPVHQLPRQHALARISTSTARRPSAGRVHWRDVFNTLQVNLGSLYVNDFNRFGRTWQVNVQADARYRRRPPDFKQIQDSDGHAGAWSR